MQSIIAVFIGGGIGAVLRYLTGIFTLKYLAGLNFPVSTFLVNIAGCFILGILFTLFINKPDINVSLKLALTAGFCGGLTTFSTFSLEIFQMFSNEHFLQGFIYIVISLFLGLAAVRLGVLCANIF